MRFRFLANDVMAIVFAVIHKLACFLIDPVIGDNSVPGRISAGGKRGVSNGCLRVGVLIVGVTVMGTLFQQITESPFAEALLKTHG